MTATQTLKNEHRMIEQVLNCLESLEAEARSGESFDRISAREAIEFFRHFADRCHHGKEEGALFPLLEARGLSRLGGPTSVMLREHDQGRDAIQGMAAAIEQNLPMRFAEYARRYVKLMREHIQKEDGCLFPMADQLLGDAGEAELAARFERIEHNDMGEGVHDNFIALANRLADRLGVARAQVTVACGCACSGKKSKLACHAT